MLTQGNSKTGRSIWCWGIPAGLTCPCKTEVCDDRCYAQKGFYLMPNVAATLYRNYEASLLDDFVQRMTEFIRKKRVSVVRIHTSGDFYSVPYIKKWHEIVRAFPHIKFFTYTRSWRAPEYREALVTFAKANENLNMWWSFDNETGSTRVPDPIKACYMSISPTDLPTTKMDLVFRDYPLRGSVVKRMNGVIVCPPENGATKDLTCEKCGICWRTRQTPPRLDIPDARRRVSLALAA
jgi:hypothetical protein